MLSAELEERLQVLMRFVAAWQPTGRTRREFWTAFDVEAGELDALVQEAGEDSELHDRFHDLILDASEVYGGPTELDDIVME